MSDRTDRTADPTGATAPAPSVTGIEPGLGGQAHDEYEGRKIVLTPLPSGLWTILLGAMCALLAPLAGFLIGSMIGTGASGREFNPMLLAFFAGIVIGAIGLVVAGLGALRMLRKSADDAA